MNHIYRIIWSKAHNAWVVCSELSKSHGKSSRSIARKLLAATALAPVAAFAAVADNALPQNGQVTGGSTNAAITTNGSKMTVDQKVNLATISWDSFNVGKSAEVEFKQPNQTSVALNRVVGSTEASQIMGKITANGQVFIENSNGIVFGKDAQLNVGGLVASTQKLTPATSCSHSYCFTIDATAKSGSMVSNSGIITAKEYGGVTFIGTKINNDGEISAKNGVITLNAAQKNSLLLNGALPVRMGRSDAVPDGTSGVSIELKRESKLIANGGKISLNSANMIRIDGDVTANEVDDGSTRTPGNVYLYGKQISFADSTYITTQGENSFGRLYIAPTDFSIAKIGGNITGTKLANLLKDNDITLIAGSNAEPHIRTGILQYTDNVASIGGDLLKLPEYAYIQKKADDYVKTLGAGATEGQKKAAQTRAKKEAFLAAGAKDVEQPTIASQNTEKGSKIYSQTSGKGNIYVADDVTWSSAHRLTLQADNDIYIGKSINVNGSGGSLKLKYGGSYYFTDDAKVNFSNAVAGQKAFITQRDNQAAKEYVVINDLGSLNDFGKDVNTLQGAVSKDYDFVVGQDINANATRTWSYTDSRGQHFGLRNDETAHRNRNIDFLNHTVSGLHVSEYGLLGTQNSANIRNLTLLNPILKTGDKYSGSNIVNHDYDDAEPFYREDQTAFKNKNTTPVGILLSRATTTSISNISVKGADISATDYPIVGGLVGSITDSALKYNSFTGNFNLAYWGEYGNTYLSVLHTPNPVVGGLVGAIESSDNSDYKTSSTLYNNTVKSNLKVYTRLHSVAQTRDFSADYIFAQHVFVGGLAGSQDGQKSITAFLWGNNVSASIEKQHPDIIYDDDYYSGKEKVLLLPKYYLGDAIGLNYNGAPATWGFGSTTWLSTPTYNAHDYIGTDLGDLAVEDYTVGTQGSEQYQSKIASDLGNDLYITKNLGGNPWGYSQKTTSPRYANDSYYSGSNSASNPAEAIRESWSGDLVKVVVDNKVNDLIDIYSKRHELGLDDITVDGKPVKGVFAVSTTNDKGKKSSITQDDKITPKSPGATREENTVVKLPPELAKSDKNIDTAKPTEQSADTSADSSDSSSGGGAGLILGVAAGGAVATAVGLMSTADAAALEGAQLCPTDPDLVKPEGCIDPSDLCPADPEAEKLEGCIERDRLCPEDPTAEKPEGCIRRAEDAEEAQGEAQEGVQTDGQETSAQ